jgi:hypothetical protein
MLFSVGSVVRPNNEAVASISITPVYGMDRVMSYYIERWDVTGRIVNWPIATQDVTTAALARLKADMLQQNVDVKFLADDGKETAFNLRASQCLLGPYVTEYSFPNSQEEVYATGQLYRVLYEARCMPSGNASNLLEFSETVSLTQVGGRHMVYVGGSVNLPERQTGIQNKTWMYSQSGSAVGLTAYPFIPNAIWPFALTNPDGVSQSLVSPVVVGNTPGLDTEFRISWEYQFEWAYPLRGLPHRRTI